MSNLRFIALSGTISVTENLYIYEAEDKMMILDCGVGFPDLEMHGVDLVIPDFSYIIKNKEKLVGILVSQGHEDHIGAIPFLLREVNVPIYAAPMPTEFLKDKFEEYGVTGATINTFNPDNDKFSIGPFVVHPFRVTHSVPDSCGFAIDTLQGRVFHVPEHKMDQDPVDGMGFDVARAKQLAQGDNLFLASDCLGSNKPGFTPNEKFIEENMYNIAEKAQHGIFATAISSNIGRFQQMINIAQKLGRKVVFVGRSVQKKTEIAHDLGILKYPKGLIMELRDAYEMPRNKVFYIISGCYGQVGSSLYRVATGEHDRLQIQEGDMMIFSADPAPPYSKESEDYVIDQLIDLGVDVHYYDLNEGLYVSGHGCQEDIVELFRIVDPKYFIPIGGSIRFMHSYKKLVEKFGRDENNVFTLKPGENVYFESGAAHRGDKVSAKEVLVHGLGIGDIGKVVLGDRAILGNEGFVVAVVKLSKEGKLIDLPEIISRGFVYEKIEKKLIQRTIDGLKRQIDRKAKDRKSAENVTKEYLEKFFYQKTRRRPMILPVIIGV